MVIECCSQERSYSNFYGLIGERFCKINRIWCDNFEQAFANYYETIHRYETNRLRNIGRFFGHLVATDAVSWGVFHAVKMNEEDTTSSSRIFVKILFTEMTESIGVKRIAERFAEPSMQGAFANIFPLDNPRDTRFSINYFTSIGLGAVTEKMREHLTVRPESCFPPAREATLTALPSPFLSPPEYAQNHHGAAAEGARGRVVRQRLVVVVRLVVRLRLGLVVGLERLALAPVVLVALALALLLALAGPARHAPPLVDAAARAPPPVLVRLEVALAPARAAQVVDAAGPAGALAVARAPRRPLALAAAPWRPVALACPPWWTLALADPSRRTLALARPTRPPGRRLRRRRRQAVRLAVAAAAGRPSWRAWQEPVARPALPGRAARRPAWA